LLLTTQISHQAKKLGANRHSWALAFLRRTIIWGN
jgi:hypothetical protein